MIPFASDHQGVSIDKHLPYSAWWNVCWPFPYGGGGGGGTFRGKFFYRGKKQAEAGPGKDFVFHFRMVFSTVSVKALRQRGVWSGESSYKTKISI